MRHGIAGRKLNRTSTHRKSLFANMACSLVEHGQIKTTLPKAKELRPYIEKLVTRGRDNTLANRRLIAATLRSDPMAKKLVETISPKFKERQGGYTRIVKAGLRSGDNTQMAIIAFVE